MTAEELLGQKLGSYQIMSILGSGGMATVYRARTSQNEEVALKVLFPPPGTDTDMLARFDREARTAARLNHPAIVPILETDRIEGRTFIAMSLIEGQTLAEQLIQVGRLDETTAADIAWQIADALYYAHSHGVVHRDVKPSNILLTDDGRALLSDFGVARTLDDATLTRTGYIVGTPAYMAPEQATEGQIVDGRADLYSLGVVLYQMVTGRLPFQGSTPEVLISHVYEPPPVPSTVAGVSSPMERVILRALAKEVTARFQTGAAMAQALAGLSNEPATKTRTPSVAIQDSATPHLSKRTQAKPAGQVSKTHRASVQNPFFYGGAVFPELFYGRRELLKTIVDRVSGRGAQSISIVGERRMGKSSLLNYIKIQADELFPAEANILLIYLDLMKAYCHTWAGLMKALRRELSRVWREPWSAGEDGDMVAFDFALEELQADGIRLLLCLDEIENLTQRAAEFNDILEDWRACAQMGQMAIITASAQPLADLCASGGLTSPFYNIFSQHWLGLLPTPAWQALVTENMAATEKDLQFIKKVAGGQPFFTQMSASYIWEAQTKGLVEHAELYQELWFQFQPHLQHLWRNLTPGEQTMLRQIVGLDTLEPNSKLLASLERRGIIHQGQLFSQLFAEMIADGHLK